MPKRTGKDLNILIGAVAISTPMGWDLEDEDVNVETTAAGDAVVDRASLRGDWTLNWEARVEIATPYILPSTVRGTLVAFSAEILASDANGLVAGTGLCTRFRLAARFDGAAETGGTIRAAGTALTYDLSPAT